MKTTVYLYNVNPSKFANLPYTDALNYKITAAKQLLTELIKPHYSERDSYRINSVIDAIKHNKQLLEELQ